MSTSEVQASTKRPATQGEIAKPGLMVGLLTASYALSFMDRGVINLLLDPIKKEFALSDTVLGLIAGFGFVLAYSTLGLLIGRIADRKHRVSIVAGAIAFWSAMTAVTSVASSVTQIVLARLGVAAGESALQGPAHSLIADQYPKDMRSRALAIYSTGPYLGIFFGFMTAGWVSHYYGWRMAFLAAGAPGLIFALAIYFLVREPVRGRMDSPRIDGRLFSLADTLHFLFRQRTFVLCLVGFCLTSYTNFALSVWVPSFLRRIHHLNGAEIGTYAGTIKGLVGVAGALAGGWAVDRFRAHRARWRLQLPAWASMLAGPVLLVFYFGGALSTALIGLMVGVFLTAVHIGPIYAVVQAVAKVRMRSFASSTMLLGASFFGNGLAPLVIGYMNDTLTPTYGDQAIRYSLASASLTSVLGGLCLWFAARSFAADVERAF